MHKEIEGLNLKLRQYRKIMAGEKRDNSILTSIDDLGVANTPDPRAYSQIEKLSNQSILDYCHQLFKKTDSIPMIFENLEIVIKKILGTDIRKVHFMVTEKSLTTSIKNSDLEGRKLRIRELEIGAERLCLVGTKKAASDHSGKKLLDKFGQQAKNK